MIRKVWKLARRPVGDIADSDLELVNEALPELADGQFLLAVIYMSLDPTNRIWMSDQEQYMPPVELGAPMRAGVCGRVVASRKAGVEPGQIMAGLGEWADHIISDGSFMSPLPQLPGVPLAASYGTLAPRPISACSISASPSPARRWSFPLRLAVWARSSAKSARSRAAASSASPAARLSAIMS
jgi:NADPH-dependent curcumin reductase CurA